MPGLRNLPSFFLFNARIFTADPQLPEATAMVVEHGRIRWIGRQEDANPGSGLATVDLQGRRVIPGIVDAHMHPLFLAQTAEQIACLPPAVHSVDDIVAAVRRRREDLARNPGHQPNPPWILGWGYDEGKLAEGRAPTRWDLDRGAADVPVVITRICYHVVAVNSKALELAGITRETPDPPGGRIDRDERGEPTGILRESARHLVLDRIPNPSPEAWAEMLAGLSPYLFARGITGITDMMARRHPVDDLELYRMARTRGLQQRVALYVLWDHLQKDGEEGGATGGLGVDPDPQGGGAARGGAPVLLPYEPIDLDPRQPVFVAGIKVFADGSISGRTAWVDPPYRGEGSHGLPMVTSQELRAAAAAARGAGVQLAVHAMGNRAIEQVAGTLVGLPAWLADGPSIRIEHATLAGPEAMVQAAQAGMAFVPQPIFLFAEIESYVNNLGEERAGCAYPLRSMLDAGVRVALSSDAPATSWSDPANPFVNVKMAVTRTASDGRQVGPGEAIPPATALALYTREAARVLRLPGVGRLAPGFAADFVVLDRDPLAVEPEEIDTVQVLATYMAGQRVYEA
ncbi:MAG TPA: amidohydrolase [Thermaerobacter sp.]